MTAAQGPPDAAAFPRRTLLLRGAAIGAGATVVGALAGCGGESAPKPAGLPRHGDGWDTIREQFALDPEVANFSMFLVASPPTRVQKAITNIRHGLDRNAVDYLNRHQYDKELALARNAARYLDSKPEQIAFTDSTTMGLGLLYGSIRLRPEQEFLTTEHDFYSTHEAIRLRARREGTRARAIRLYQRVDRTSTDEIVESIRRGLRPNTRVLALTWVHSGTGLKLPLAEIAEMLRGVNGKRDDDDRVLLCVDGVHGFGAEAETPAKLGCDFFSAGCHKWLFGPRGTGVLWSRDPRPTLVGGAIPSFGPEPFLAWLRRGSRLGLGGVDVPFSTLMSPGGLHTLEHRYALADAFDSHLLLGRQRIANRTGELARRLKEALAAIPGVTVHTPMSRHLSAGLVCFSVAGAHPLDVVGRLAERKFQLTPTPYHTRYVRAAPTIVNAESEIDRLAAAVQTIALTPTVRAPFRRHIGP